MVAVSFNAVFLAKINGATITIHHAVANGDYDAISNLQLEFNTGDTEQCYNVTINQDDICENDPNENFIVSLTYVSGTLPITVAPDEADVIIDDVNEPECGEFYQLLDQLHVDNSVLKVEKIIVIST